MKSIVLLGLIYLLTSCQLLLSPSAVAIEEEIVQEIAKEIVDYETQNK